MAKETKRPVRFRDTKTGRFVSKSTWKRSRAHGGTRYKRERLKPAHRARPARPPALPVLTEEELAEIEFEEQEYQGAFDTGGKDGQGRTP